MYKFEGRNPVNLRRIRLFSTPLFFQVPFCLPVWLLRQLIPPLPTARPPLWLPSGLSSHLTEPVGPPSGPRCHLLFLTLTCSVQPLRPSGSLKLRVSARFRGLSLYPIRSLFNITTEAWQPSFTIAEVSAPACLSQETMHGSPETTA